MHKNSYVIFDPKQAVDTNTTLNGGEKMKKKIISFSILVVMLMLVSMLAATSAASACGVNSHWNIVPASQKTGAVLNKVPEVHRIGA